MDSGPSRKIVAIAVCLGSCVFAQAQVRAPEAGPLEAGPRGAGPQELRLPSELPESRLPGEPPPPFAFKWGTDGAGNDQFHYPWGVTIDASGNIYVADSVNHRVQKFDSSGTFISTLGTFGSGDGQFNLPTGVAVETSGNIYVVDSNNRRVEKFDSSGTFIGEWGAFGAGDGEFSAPRGLAIDSSGNVYVADNGNDRIQKFDSSGTFLTTWGTTGSGDGQFDHPSGVAVDASGDVYVADTNNARIQKFDASGGFIKKWDTISFPTNVAVDVSGNVYATIIGTWSRVQKFDSSGTFLTEWGSEGSGDGQFDAPRGVAVDASGNVYVSDYLNHRVQKFGPPYETLVFITKWGFYGSGDGQLDQPWGVAVDASGDVYVAEYGNERIQKFDRYGTFLAKWGSAGTGDGQFDRPAGVAVDASGNVYVADTYNNRIQKFDKYGNFLTNIGTPGSGDGQLSVSHGVAVDATGNVYVADTGNNRIQKFDGTGTFLRMWGWGVATGGSGFEICTSTCQAGSSGSGDGQFDAPLGVVVDATGNVYVADFNNSRVQKFDNSGAFVTKWGAFGSGDGQFKALVVVAVDASGNVYVSEHDNDRIQKFDSSGTFITKWGTLGTADGQFDKPTGVAVDASGNVYVADYTNHNIQKFSRCSFSTDPGNGLAGFAGGAATFDLDAVSTGCGWTATSNDSWIHVTSDPEGFGDGSVDYSVDPNPTAISRAGTISLADRTTGGSGDSFVVLQDPAPCTYGLSSTTASFSGTAGADFVSVTSLLGCAWTAVSNDGWISVDAGAAGNGSGFVLYSVAANAGSAARSGTMTIAGSAFTVNQDPQVPDAPSNLAGPAAGSTRVQLTWDDNATNEAWYRIERKLGAAGTFASVLTVPADSTGAQDSTVQGNTTYVYRVLACNSAGCSAPSAEVEVTTPALGVFIGEEPKGVQR